MNAAIYAETLACAGAVDGGVGGGLHCDAHPREVLVGVCARCLKEKLLQLLVLQPDLRSDRDGDRAAAVAPPPFGMPRSRSNGSVVLPRVFALGSLLRIDSSQRRRRHTYQFDDSDSSSSVATLDDSFISIKFEDNGAASWDGRVNSAGGGGAGDEEDRPQRKSAVKELQATKSIVEHGKRIGGGGGGATGRMLLRWRKQIGRLLQAARWRRWPAKPAPPIAAEVGRRAGSGRNRGTWMRNLTPAAMVRRKTTAMEQN